MDTIDKFKIRVNRGYNTNLLLNTVGIRCKDTNRGNGFQTDYCIVDDSLKYRLVAHSDFKKSTIPEVFLGNLMSLSNRNELPIVLRECEVVTICREINDEPYTKELRELYIATRTTEEPLSCKGCVFKGRPRYFYCKAMLCNGNSHNPFILKKMTPDDMMDIINVG